MPILCLLQLQTPPQPSCKCLVLDLTSVRPQASLPSYLGPIQGAKPVCIHVQSRKLHPEQNLRYRAVFFLLVIMFNVHLYQPISLHYKNNKKQTLTELRAGGCSSLSKVELGHNAIHMKSDIKPPGCHDVLYITVSSIH